MTRTAVYAGSFDPITRGHEDLIKRSLGFVDRIVVAVATNVSKQPLFTLEERVEFIREAVGKDERVEVRQFNGLLVDFAKLNNLFRVWIRQRPQQHCINDTEDRCRRADTQRERDDGNRSEARPLPQTAKSVANVFN